MFACNEENPGCLAPEAPYERTGDVNDVVFPCGQTIDADGDGINLYYGAADSCIALATGSIRALLGWLDTLLLHWSLLCSTQCTRPWSSIAF
jgi:predicted GH43/DUF377 family glycosyl hydrolase